MPPLEPTVTFPIEGRTDCRCYTGFEGMLFFNGQTFGVMHCSWREYQNAVCGAKSAIGGILTYWCETCGHYEPKPEPEEKKG